MLIDGFVSNSSQYLSRTFFHTSANSISNLVFFFFEGLDLAEPAVDEDNAGLLGQVDVGVAEEELESELLFFDVFLLQCEAAEVEFLVEPEVYESDEVGLLIFAVLVLEEQVLVSADLEEDRLVVVSHLPDELDDFF